MNRTFFLVCLAALGLSSAVVSSGHVDSNQSVESVARLWGDLFWDANRVTGRVVHVASHDESALGNRLSAALSLPEDVTQAVYVQAVGDRLTPHVTRKSITYTFHVITDPSLNAFSLPGGHVYITTGLLDFAQTEAEVAAVLGHEIAHIDFQHCIDQQRYEAIFPNSDVATLADAIRSAHRRAYSQIQEYDADSRGLLYVVLAGYDPRGASVLFRRMESLTVLPQPSGHLSEFFTSHPPDAARAQRLDSLLVSERPHIRGHRFYVGAGNLRLRVSRTDSQTDGEFITMPD